jgi:hypothetical protein
VVGFVSMAKKAGFLQRWETFYVDELLKKDVAAWSQFISLA